MAVIRLRNSTLSVDDVLVVDDVVDGVVEVAFVVAVVGGVFVAVVVFVPVVVVDFVEVFYPQTRTIQTLKSIVDILDFVFSFVLDVSGIGNSLRYCHNLVAFDTVIRHLHHRHQ